MTTLTINYGIVAIDEDGAIVHFVGYENRPTKTDFDEIYEELKTDPEFDLMDDDFILEHATQEQIEYVIAEFGKEISDDNPTLH